jgi:hypothetical protein
MDYWLDRLALRQNKTFKDKVRTRQGRPNSAPSGSEYFGLLSSTIVAWRLLYARADRVSSAHTMP